MRSEKNEGLGSLHLLRRHSNSEDVLAMFDVIAVLIEKARDTLEAASEEECKRQQGAIAVLRKLRTMISGQSQPGQTVTGAYSG